jgi:hypothetical protein
MTKQRWVALPVVALATCLLLLPMNSQADNIVQPGSPGIGHLVAARVPGADTMTPIFSYNLKTNWAAEKDFSSLGVPYRPRYALGRPLHLGWTEDAHWTGYVVSNSGGNNNPVSAPEPGTNLLLACSFLALLLFSRFLHSPAERA